MLFGPVLVVIITVEPFWDKSNGQCRSRLTKQLAIVDNTSNTG